ncbi:hypothetical protein GCM10023325_03330 [Sphingomonas lutea]
MNEELNQVTPDVHDSEYFRRRAAEARAAAFCKDRDEAVEVNGDLALAYAALARRRAVTAERTVETPAIPLAE